MARPLEVACHPWNLHSHWLFLSSFYSCFVLVLTESVFLLHLFLIKIASGGFPCYDFPISSLLKLILWLRSDVAVVKRSYGEITPVFSLCWLPLLPNPHVRWWWSGGGGQKARVCF